MVLFLLISKRWSIWKTRSLLCLRDGTTKIINLDSGTHGSGGYDINHWNAANLSDGRVAVLSSLVEMVLMDLRS